MIHVRVYLFSSSVYSSSIICVLFSLMISEENFWVYFSLSLHESIPFEVSLQRTTKVSLNV